MRSKEGNRTMSIKITFKIVPKVLKHQKQLIASGTFENTEHNAISFNTSAISSAALALEVRGPQGIVSLGPPPVPPKNDVRITLAPKKKHTAEYKHFLPDTLPAGKYEIRLRYRDITADIHSDWKSFKIS